MENEHSGHRERMRKRFRENGLDGFAPHEILELLLFFSSVRGDTNPIAHRLIEQFGSLKGVLEATPEQLMRVKGVGEASATLIGLMLPMFRKYSAAVIEETQRITCRSDAEDYCQALLAGERSEKIYCICLDASGNLLGRKLIAEGTIDQVSAYPRKIAEIVLNQNAHAVVLCHNHPSGQSEPSEDDIIETIRIANILKELNVILLDHIVVAGSRCFSMAQHGDLIET